MSICYYTVVTLRDSCIRRNIESFKKFYEDVDILVIDNCREYCNIQNLIGNEYEGVSFLKNDEIYPLTKIQNAISSMLFEEYDNLMFASDDISFLEGGFIEESLDMMKGGDIDFVSLSTARDPVSYVYNKKFHKNIKFNEKLLGKEATDNSIIKQVVEFYGKMNYIGKYWRKQKEGWESKYVLNPHLDNLGKNNVNQLLEEIGIDSGQKTNKGLI